MGVSGDHGFSAGVAFPVLRGEVVAGVGPMGSPPLRISNPPYGNIRIPSRKYTHMPRGV